MHYRIEIAVTETDTIRGMHERTGTVTLVYAKPNVQFTKEREKEIVEAVTMGSGFYMWSSVTHKSDGEGQSVWSVRYGYDSGD